ncbi:hypothetical protein [Actinoplanes sp. L3-i22]|uniref:hypothetical protein n=1 Tax=Actinoplanes sp. L3-i22 TaxID=2836373 RepID=UPI001C75D679|nr:hypothetical protein [Actinoplanes sp. L3-i22]BCY09084.1 hypothetical protein L3i22_041720 [Actinoplanes sp. L3-i22]
MLRMTSLTEVITVLRDAGDNDFRARCVEALSAPIDWAAAVRDHLAAVTDDSFADGTKKIFVEGVEPKTLLLHDEPDKFRIVLNHFDKASFLAHQREGRITPHYHHFDFATRVIGGSYHHLLFDNDGDLAAPRLSLRHRTKDDAGHVYVLPWDEFHCVLAPEPQTMSLQIRSPARCRPNRRPLRTTTRDLLVARDTALDALDDLPSTAENGRVPDFARCWL